MPRLQWHSKGVIFSSNSKQVTCYGHDTGRCDYSFPHRLGSNLCAYHNDTSKCESCSNGYCEFHRYDDGYDPRAEALTAYERNI